MHLHILESILAEESGPFSISAEVLKNMGLSEQKKNSFASLADKHGWVVRTSQLLPERELVYTVYRRGAS